MQQALQADYRPINAKVALTFERVLPSTQQVGAATLADTDILLLEKTRITPDLAQAAQDTMLQSLAAENIRPLLKRSAISFDLVAAYPYALQQLVEDERFKHLKAIAYNLPATPDGPASRLLYFTRYGGHHSDSDHRSDGRRANIPRAYSGRTVATS